MARFLFVLSAVAVMTIASPGRASVVFDNPWDRTINGACDFNTSCGSSLGTFAAQRFSLSTSATLKRATFTVLTNDLEQPTSVNWLVLAADGTDGLPATLLGAGNATITARRTIAFSFGTPIVTIGYDLPSVQLSAGDYFIGLQAVSANEWPFLLRAYSLGAAQSDDGGASWSTGYGGGVFSGVAMSLSGTVPEPASWAMMIAGFGLVGAAMRRRALAIV